MSMKVGDRLVLRAAAPASETRRLKPEMEIVRIDGTHARLAYQKPDGSIGVIHAQRSKLERYCQVKN